MTTTTSLRTGKRGHWGSTMIRHGVLLLLLCFFLLPLYWLVRMAFGPTTSPGTSFILPFDQLTFDNFVWVVTDSKFFTWLGNSVIVSVASAIIGVTVSVLAAYALTRLRFRGRRLIMGAVVSTQLIPSILLAIPLFAVLTMFRLNDTLFGLVITYISLVLPFGIWLMYGFFNQLPVELEEAAFLDGATRLQVLLRILIPIAAPGIATVALFSFILAWEDFLFGVMLLSTDSNLTLTVAASRFVSDQLTYYGYLGAFAVMALIPILAIFIFLQKFVVRGLTHGAVK